ncbi:MAG: porin [Isosphaeraceae bacterium]
MHWPGRRTRTALISAAALLYCTMIKSQAQQVTSPEPFGGAAARDGVPSIPPPSVPAAAPASREAQLEARVQQLEAMVQRLSTQIQQAGRPAGGGTGGRTSGTGDAAPDVGSRASTAAPSQMGGPSAPGQSLPPNPPPSARFDSPATLESKKANVKFGPGFEIRSDDDEYIFQFHNLTQFEYRGDEQGGETNVRDSFLIPRQWYMFSGRITRPIGYFVSLAHGIDSVNTLDAFLDFDFDPRFRIRAGRYKTPFTYEFFVDPIQGLILPERSIFFNNFGQNRDLGVMAFGRVFNNTLDYATGIFNGNRNGYVATADSKYVSSFLNWKPFNNAQGSILENFNIGGSVFGGNSTQLPVPTVLRTIVPIAGNSVAGVPFLAFNSNVRESGMKTFWDLHSAWYYRQLAVIAEWGSGFQDYAINPRLANRTHLPVDGWYVQAGYLLTGETRSGLGVVKPRRPFSLKPGNLGFGAWELTGRYSTLTIGDEVFKNGLADPNLWANRVDIVDVGFNWHINQYVKFYFDWEHSMFNQPVLYAPGARQLTNDLFLARIQLFF